MKIEKVDTHQIESAPVLLIQHSDRLPLAAVRPDYFGLLVGAQASPVNVARELERRGVLIPRGNRRRTRQIQIPGTKRRKDYYCLRLPTTVVSSHVRGAQNVPVPITESMK